LLAPALLAVALAGCASRQPVARQTRECDVSWIRDDVVGARKACVLRALAERCAISDQCYIACEANGGATDVGGGCEHACMNAAQTDGQIARNGGPYMTREAVDCYNAKQHE